MQGNPLHRPLWWFLIFHLNSVASLAMEHWGTCPLKFLETFTYLWTFRKLPKKTMKTC